MGGCLRIVTAEKQPVTTNKTETSTTNLLNSSDVPSRIDYVRGNKIGGYVIDYPSYSEIAVWIRYNNADTESVTRANLPCNGNCDGVNGNHRFLVTVPPVACTGGDETVTVTVNNITTNSRPFFIAIFCN